MRLAARAVPLAAFLFLCAAEPPKLPEVEEPAPFVPPELKALYEQHLAACKNTTNPTTAKPEGEAMAEAFKAATTDPPWPEDRTFTDDELKEEAKKAAVRRAIRKGSLAFFRERIPEADPGALQCLGHLFMAIEQADFLAAVQARIKSLLNKSLEKEGVPSEALLRFLVVVPDGSGTETVVELLEREDISEAAKVEVYKALGYSVSPRSFEPLLKGYLEKSESILLGVQVGFQNLKNNLGGIQVDPALAAAQISKVLPQVSVEVSRHTLLQTLCRLQQPNSLPMLLAEKNAPAFTTRGLLAEDFRYYWKGVSGDSRRQVEEALIEFGRDAVPYVRSAAVLSMREVKSIEFVPFLISRLDSTRKDSEENEEIRKQIVSALEATTGNEECKLNPVKWREYWNRVLQERASGTP
ncbi:MAG: HEAT repeat domain-containing protein [Planctomycetota bacterium]